MVHHNTKQGVQSYHLHPREYPQDAEYAESVRMQLTPFRDSSNNSRPFARIVLCQLAWPGKPGVLGPGSVGMDEMSNGYSMTSCMINENPPPHVRVFFSYAGGWESGSTF